MSPQAHARAHQCGGAPDPAHLRFERSAEAAHAWDTAKPCRSMCSEFSTGARRAADLRAVQAGPPRLDAAGHRPPGPGAPGRAAPLEPAAPSRALRAGDRPPLHGARRPDVRRRHRLLPAGLVHDEAQPADERARRGAARVPRPASAPGGGRRAGCDGAHVAPPGDPRRGRRARRRLAPAGRGIPGRADRPDAHARLLRGSRRGRARATRSSSPTRRTGRTRRA